MTPLIATSFFAINPVVGVLALTGVSLTMFIASTSDKKPEPAPAKKPEQKAAESLQKTEAHVKKIAIDTLKQRSVLTAATTTVNQNTKRIEHTGKQLEQVAKVIEHQTGNTQSQLRELERLRRDLASTTAALKASQKALEQQENRFNEVTNDLQKTHTELKNTIAVQKEQVTKALNHSIRTVGKQRQVMSDLLDAKKLEIDGLKKEIEAFRATTRTLEERVSQALSAKTQVAPTKQMRSVAFLKEESVFQPLKSNNSMHAQKNTQTGAQNVITKK